MRRKLIAGLVTVVSLLCFIGMAQASTIYQQTYNPYDTGAYFADNPSYTMYDNFTLTQSAKVSGASIWGVYWSDGQVPSPANFALSFYTSTNWNSPFYSYVGSAVSVTDTGYDHNSYPGANIVELQFQFSAPVDLVAGQEYYLGVQALNPQLNTFAWQNSFPVDYRYYQNTNLITDGDVAFSLDAAGAPVPEPSSLLLVGAGVAALGLLRRRAKR